MDVKNEVKEIKINYTEAYKNSFWCNTTKATQFFLDAEVGQCFTISPFGLNPFLKVMETLGHVKQVGILPAYENDEATLKKPLYLIVKLPEVKYVTEFVLSDD
jgi:hypothetical protein